MLAFGGMGAGERDEVTGSISALSPWKCSLPVGIVLHVSPFLLWLREKKIESHWLSPVTLIL